MTLCFKLLFETIANRMNSINKCDFLEIDQQTDSQADASNEWKHRATESTECLASVAKGADLEMSSRRPGWQTTPDPLDVSSYTHKAPTKKIV